MTTEIQPGWYSVKGAAVYTSFSKSSIENAINLGQLRSLRVTITGSQTSRRMRREWLDEWVMGWAAGETVAISPARCDSGPQLDSSISEQVERCLGNLSAAAERFHAVAERMEQRADILEQKYLTLAGAAKYCGLAKRTLEDAAKANSFKTFVRARRRLVVRASLDSWIEGVEPPTGRT